MSKIYGSISNRFEEGKNFTGREIQEGLDNDEFAKVINDKEVVKYNNLEKISFGVRRYYYDWEF